MEAVSPNSSSAVTPSERLVAAQQARRSIFVRGGSALLGLLTVLAVGHMFFMRAQASTLLSSAAALVGYASAYWLSDQRFDARYFFRSRARGRASTARGWNRPPRLAAAVLIGTMQVQHIASALSVLELSEMSNSIMFSGMLPLIAAATLNLRGTVIASLFAVLAIPVLYAAKVKLGGDVTLVGRALGAPLFFVLMGAVVSILSALAERRSLAEAIERERAAVEAQAAAAAAEQRFRLVADQVSDLVSVLDAQGRHTFVSASYTS
jgi:PAS domain-containing protein